jgi:hypothetical protein
MFRVILCDLHLLFVGGIHFERQESESEELPPGLVRRTCQMLPWPTTAWQPLVLVSSLQLVEIRCSLVLGPCNG